MVTQFYFFCPHFFYFETTFLFVSLTHYFVIVDYVDIYNHPEEAVFSYLRPIMRCYSWLCFVCVCSMCVCDASRCEGVVLCFDGEQRLNEFPLSPSIVSVL